MKSEKGFTLVELLAVVLVLGIVAAIVTMSITGIRKNAEKSTFARLEKQITDLGPQIHSHEFLVGSKASGSYYSLYKSGSPFIITLHMLQTNGYIDNIENPFGSGNCEGYLYVVPATETSTSDVYKAYLKCADTYTDDDATKYNNNSRLSPADITTIN